MLVLLANLVIYGAINIACSSTKKKKYEENKEREEKLKKQLDAMRPKNKIIKKEKTFNDIYQECLEKEMKKKRRRL